MKHYVIIFLVTILLGGLSTTISQRETYFGSIKGKIVDFETKQTLPGVNIILKESSVGTSSNLDGEYEIPHLKIGSYSLVFSFIGYEKIIVPDIIIRSDRITYVNVELRSTAIDLQSVEVTGGYFNNTQQQQLSAVSFSFEEIRRAPGAGGDVSRIIFGLPSLAKINDTKNSLIVRGGSPVENGFFVDNIEIPNINHFPVQGSSEGPIGIINVDLIDNVNFYSGGFGSNYGNKLSSIMEIKFREGNRSTNDVQLDMSMQGFGGVFEGPINAGRGSFVISARRSYLDLVLDLMNENVGLPVYSDIQGKVVYDISENDKLSIIDVFSYDQQKMNQNDAAENHNNVFIDYKYYTNTAGINWQRLWGTLGYSNTSISHTFAKTDGRFIQTRDAKLLLNNLSDEHEIKFRNSNHLILGSNLNLNFGFEYKGIFTKYNQFYNEYQDLLGNKTEALTLNKENTSLIVGAFTGIEWRPFSNLIFAPNIRADYYSINKTETVSPRISVTYLFNELTSLTGSYGFYYQNIPAVITMQKDEFTSLKNPKSVHAVISLNHLLSESTKLTLEVYNKEYFNFPMNPSQPSLFLFDQAVQENLFLTHSSLKDNGEARSRGIELTIQKKLAENFYGLAAASYSKAEYKGLNSNWYNRIYDNQFTFAIEGGYKPNDSWEFSARWLYAGGAPYTPFDINASTLAFKGVFDEERINSQRLPDFHSLNIRADKRFHFKNSTLIVYLSVWNTYARNNIASYSWNEVENRQLEEKMWGLLPIFGIEFEF